MGMEEGSYVTSIRNRRDSRLFRGREGRPLTAGHLRERVRAAAAIRKTAVRLALVSSMRLRHLHPVPAADLSQSEASRAILRIPIRQHLPDLGSDPVNRTMAAGTHGLLHDGP